MKQQKNESKLTPKENEILELIVSGKSIKEISILLVKSYHTVENQKRSILKKLNLKKQIELIRFAIENQIV